MSDYHLGIGNGLYFPPDVQRMRTPLRDSALEFFYKAALDLAGDRVKAAEIMISDMPEEEDSEILDPVLTLDADWDFIHKLQNDILVNTREWVGKLTDDECSDLSRRVFFTLLPVDL